MPPPLPLVRNIVLGTTNFLALLILALAAYTLSRTGTFVYFTFSALAVATAVLHLVSVCAMIAVGLSRDGAFTSRVSFEVGWLSYLCVMWLATGSETAGTLGGITGCGGDSFCGVTQAIAAFGFLNWIILLGYVITLIVAAVQAGQAGKNIWLTDVKEVQWAMGPTSFEKNINSSNPTVAVYPPGNNPNYGAPPSVVPQSQPNYPQYGGRPPV